MNLVPQDRRRRVPVDIETLHETLFGFRPSKAGTAYERVTAVVLASLGWTRVLHDVTARGEGRKAEHQIDVTASDPGGSVARLLVECKDWSARVGKQTVDALVGVRDQIGADAAAIVTMAGYTEGARTVASDEDIALLRLQPYDADPTSSQTPFVERVEVRTVHYGASYGELQVDLLDPSDAIGAPMRTGRLSTGHRLQHLDGRPAEQIQEILAMKSAGMNEGRFEHRCDFGDGRLLTIDGAAPLRIAALRWVEVVGRGEMVSVIEMEGTPVVVIEELEADGRPQSGRLLISEDLFAWDLSDDGAVVARGRLLKRHPSSER